jgi:hypothetical protein
MTNPEIIRLKAIVAILEAIDQDDEKDARQAIEMIRGLVGPDKEAK